jgi:hypothetical protein
MYDWQITEERIEGLWEECKPKYKLIDILNKIANGELKEGTKVELGNKTYAWDSIECCLYNENEYFMCLDPMKCLNDEVELIEPNHSPDVGKMAEPTDNTKIEELVVDETDINCLGIHSKTILLNIIDKLNKVIRYINKED